MPTLTITRGLSGSGKTTWAQSQPGIRVNRDDIRMQLFGRFYTFDYASETTVSRLQQQAVESLIRTGLDVIVDDTNLRLKYARAWATMAARLDAEFICVDFDVDIETCISRDAARVHHSVGEAVIRGMATRYGPLSRIPIPEAFPVSVPTVEPYVPAPCTPPAVMVDIDGTLALHGDRDPYDTSRYMGDTVNESVARLVQILDVAGYVIILCSGRSEDFRDVTEAWLTHENVSYDLLLMRPSGDNRRDDIIKLELFDNHIRTQYNVLAVLDDRDRVVAAWRSIGLTVLQVAPGDF